MLILFQLLLLCCVSKMHTEICEMNEIQIYADTVFISSEVNRSIIGSTEQCSSALRCLQRCSQCNMYSSFYFSVASQECHCNTQLDDGAITTPYSRLIYGITYERSQYLPISRLRELQKDRDCLSLYQQGFSTDGVYMIHPVGGVPVEAWCDMTGGGWTVIQRRQDGSEDFYRGWDDYVKGFGNKTGEYWMGLENMRIMTTEASIMRIELETFGDKTPIYVYAEYSSFAIESSASNYQLTVHGFSGNCGDSLTYHNGMAFSTPDRDQTNCAVQFKGAWWYKACHYSNLNGMYLSGVTSSYGDGMTFTHVGVIITPSRPA